MTRLSGPAASALGAFVLLRASPAFACAGACSTDAFTALPFLAGIAGAVLLVGRLVGFARQRAMARAMKEAEHA